MSPLCHHINFYDSAKEKPNRCLYNALSHKCPNMWSNKRWLQFLLLYHSRCLFALWCESMTSLELPVLSSCPGQTLLRLERPNPLCPGNSCTELGPSSSRDTSPAFPTYRDVSQRLCVYIHIDQVSVIKGFLYNLKCQKHCSGAQVFTRSRFCGWGLATVLLALLISIVIILQQIPQWKDFKTPAERGTDLAHSSSPVTKENTCSNFCHFFIAVHRPVLQAPIRGKNGSSIF